MAEVNKEELRKLALEWIAASDKVDATDDDDDFLEFNAVDEVWQVEASGDTVLSLLDENAGLVARIAELERDCERLREDHDKEWRRSETNAQNVIAMAAELETCRKDAERLRALLVEASETIEEWGAYADDYFKEKHGLARDVAYYRDAAMQEGGANG